MYINGLHFKQTCFMCPEQYDILNDDGEIVGHVRLRWGELTCEYPDVGGDLIYFANVGDGFTGCFDNNEEKMRHLNSIAQRILEIINK